MSNLNLNKVVLAGRITADPELKLTPSNISVISGSIAINRPVRVVNNERVAEVDYINFVAWRKTAEFIAKYVDKYGKDTLNQFGASAYDCVYAIYYAMEKAIADGKEIPVTISASDLCDILKDMFANGYTLENGVTGKDITWEANGYVNKQAIQYVIKDAAN